MTDLELTTSVTIEAPIERVWEAITDPGLIERWFFGVDTETDWRVGGPLVHRGEYQGTPYEDKGTVLAFEPPRLLRHTHWSSVSGLPDADEHYQTVSWSLSEDDGGTRLTITEINLPSEDAAKTSAQGWAAALDQLKKLLEG
jgi:uncharacterized protein YndB with AHSA1/START domain